MEMFLTNVKCDALVSKVRGVMQELRLYEEQLAQQRLAQEALAPAAVHPEQPLETESGEEELGMELDHLDLENADDDTMAELLGSFDDAAVPAKPASADELGGMAKGVPSKDCQEG